MSQKLFLTQVFFIFAGLFSLNAYAQQMNVIQVKGNRAIVEVQTGERLKVGESYAVGKVDGDISLDTSAIKQGRRDYLVGIDAQLSSTKEDRVGAETVFEIDGTVKFGWNKKQYEYGPLLSVEYLKVGGIKPTYTFGAGAFGTYNFQPNLRGNDLIYSGDAQFVFQQTKQGSASAFNTMTMTVGPFAKLFAFSEDFCFRAGFVFLWQRSSPSTGDVTTTGAQLVAGINTYF